MATAAVPTMRPSVETRTSVDAEIERIVGPERWRLVKAALLNELRTPDATGVILELDRNRAGQVHGAHVSRRRSIG